jgi:hypothetical protein
MSISLSHVLLAVLGLQYSFVQAGDVEFVGTGSSVLFLDETYTATAKITHPAAGDVLVQGRLLLKDNAADSATTVSVKATLAALDSGLSASQTDLSQLAATQSAVAQAHTQLNASLIALNAARAALQAKEAALEAAQALLTSKQQALLVAQQNFNNSMLAFSAAQGLLNGTSTFGQDKAADCANFLIWADEANTVSNMDINADLRFRTFKAGQEYAGGFDGSWHWYITFPRNGTYMVETLLWQCGAGSGVEAKIRVQRGSTNGPFYITKWLRTGSPDCSVQWVKHPVTVLAGDILTIKSRTNGGGAYTGEVNPIQPESSLKLQITCRNFF